MSITTEQLISQTELSRKVKTRRIFWNFALWVFAATVFMGIFSAIFNIQEGSPQESLLTLFTDIAVTIFIFRYASKQINQAGVHRPSIIGKLEVETKPLLHTAGLITIIAAAGLTFGMIFLNALLRLLAWLAEMEPTLNFTELFEAIPSTHWLEHVSFFIMAIVIAPIFEEWIFRGIILNNLLEKRSTVNALVWSSLLFMFGHLTIVGVPQFLVGLGLGVLYIKTKRLIYPIIGHALYNLLIWLPGWFSFGGNNPFHDQFLVEQGEAALETYGIMAWSFLAFLLLAIVAIIFYGKGIKKETVTPYQFDKKS